MGKYDLKNDVKIFRQRHSEFDKGYRPGYHLMDKKFHKKQNVFMVSTTNSAELFATLEGATSELLQILSSFGDENINLPPSEGNWSAGQIAEHITSSNNYIIESLTSTGRICRRDIDEGVRRLSEVFLDFSTKLQSPPPILPTGNYYEREEVLNGLRKSVEQLKRVSKNINLFEVVDHPIFGEISRFELLHFVVVHTRRHIHQLEKIFNNIMTRHLAGLRKIILQMNVSLDGFISGENGQMDWICFDQEMFEDEINRENSIDTALYGRVTYQMMERYWPTVLANPASSYDELHHALWVHNIQKIVFSTTLEKVKWNNTRLIREHIPQEILKLKHQPGKSMMIFGGPTLAHSFMRLGLIDEYRLNINPVILGNGIPLFKNPDHAKLKFLKSRVFQSGVVALHYEIRKN